MASLKWSLILPSACWMPQVIRESAPCMSMSKTISLPGHKPIVSLLGFARVRPPPRLQALHHTSHITHHTSHIKHQTSNIKHQTSNIKHQTSHKPIVSLLGFARIRPPQRRQPPSSDPNTTRPQPHLPFFLTRKK
jgi:hypothetical protein